MKFNQYFSLIVLLLNGDLILFDVKEQKNLLQTNILCLLKNPHQGRNPTLIKKLVITNENEIFVHLKSNVVFSYDYNLKSWKKSFDKSTCMFGRNSAFTAITKKMEIDENEIPFNLFESRQDCSPHQLNVCDISNLEVLFHFDANLILGKNHFYSRPSSL